MKIIAHRNETPGCPENSIASLEYSAQDGIYAVECDVRHTADGQYVIYHDETLKRLIGVDAAVGEITLDEMRRLLRQAGRDVITLQKLIAGYRKKTPILLHIKENTPKDDFVEILRNASVEFIFGVQTVAMLNALKPFTAQDHLLAFMPEKTLYPEFIKNGIGIIRLWEHWLDEITPDMVHEAGAKEVWIMCRTPEKGMDGTPESLDKFLTLNVDGALISDVAMAKRWMASKE